MPKSRGVVLVLAAVVAIVLCASKELFPAEAKPSGKAVSQETCYACHEEIKGLKVGSKHARLACGTCHENLDKHV